LRYRSFASNYLIGFYHSGQ